MDIHIPDENIVPATEANTVFTKPQTDEALRLWKLESALERIANSKHGDRQWMQSVARQALDSAHRDA